nr:MAG TPA: hypothetical protein [Caudoviricetes sp.]
MHTNARKRRQNIKSHLICNHQVVSSSLTAGLLKNKGLPREVLYFFILTNARNCTHCPHIIPLKNTLGVKKG